jgi:exosortase family protein XrtF
LLKNSYLSKWNKVPVAVRRFILRAAIILIVWKIVYLAFLLPNRVLDKPLSYAVAIATTWLLNTTTHSADYHDVSEIGNIPTDSGFEPYPLENIYFHHRNVVSIEDGCNGLELIVLYIGFIVCMPATNKRKINFIITGTLLIYIVNVIRCAGVAYIILYYPKYADFAHHYVFTFIVYGLIIGLWLSFSKKLDPVYVQTEQ